MAARREVVLAAAPALVERALIAEAEMELHR